MNFSKHFSEYMVHFLELCAMRLGIKINFLPNFCYILEMRQNDLYKWDFQRNNLVLNPFTVGIITAKFLSPVLKLKLQDRKLWGEIRTKAKYVNHEYSYQWPNFRIRETFWLEQSKLQCSSILLSINHFTSVCPKIGGLGFDIFQRSFEKPVFQWSSRLLSPYKNMLKGNKCSKENALIYNIMIWDKFREWFSVLTQRNKPIFAANNSCSPVCGNRRQHDLMACLHFGNKTFLNAEDCLKTWIKSNNFCYKTQVKTLF